MASAYSSNPLPYRFAYEACSMRNAPAGRVFQGKKSGRRKASDLALATRPSTPVLLRLPPNRSTGGVLHLEPVRRAARAIRHSRVGRRRGDPGLDAALAAEADQRATRTVGSSE